MTERDKTIRMCWSERWQRLCYEHPTLAQFIIFFILSNGVTIFQLLLMPVLRGAFAQTSLVETAFRLLPVGTNPDGSQYYIFNYAAGPIQADGSGGGLAYFLAVQITLAIAQVINFFAQRNITFKSNTSVAKAAFWYTSAYIAITLTAGILQTVYKEPVYNLLMNILGSRGELIADVVTMLINTTISFLVFFPIFKLIFRRKPENQ